jgi:protease IV
MNKPHPWLLTLLFIGGIGLVLFLVVGALFLWWDHGGLLGGGDRVAVVRLEGMVTDPQPVVDALERFGKEPKVRAIVLRIETPGGAVGPTQEIFRAVRIWNQKKRVVASLGSIATSGGYYVACGAERIIANPGTITGSIGVVVHLANLEKLLGKVGIEGEVIKSGAHKDMGSPHRSLTVAERELMQGVVDDVHDQFVQDVAEGRNLTKEAIRALADGRIFSGKQALQLGLVDELGGLREAVRAAADMAGIVGEPAVIEEPKERLSLLSFLLGRSFSRFLSTADPWVPFIGYVFHP